MKVILIAAISADGFIGRDSNHTADWTSKDDKKLFIQITKRSGVMIMGSNTFKTIGRALPGRKTIIYSSDPDQFSGIEGDIDVTDEPVSKLIERLDTEGYDSVAICGGAQIYGQFLKAKLVNEIYLTVEPVLFGSGVPLSLGLGLVNLKLLSSQKLNQDSILLHYEVIGS